MVTKKLYRVSQCGTTLAEYDLVRTVQGGWFRVKYGRQDGSIDERKFPASEGHYYTTILADALRKQVARLTKYIAEQEKNMKGLRAKLEEVKSQM
jgi:hypothetical protein